MIASFLNKFTSKALLLLLFFFVSACSEKNEPTDKESFYIISGNAPDDTQIFVNGNPTNKGHAISIFLTEGENKINYRSEFKEDGYQLKIIKTKDIFSSSFETIVDIEKDQIEARKSSITTMSIDHWWRWSWQDCDTIKEFNDSDKETILNLFDSICKSASNFEKKQNFLTEHKDILPWSTHPFYTKRSEKLRSLVMSNLPPRAQLTETKASRDDIEFFIGKQIIMIKPINSEKLYDLSKKTTTVNEADGNGIKHRYFLGFDVMFFVKEDGLWKMILPVV